VSTVFRGPDHKTLTLARLAGLTGRAVNAHGTWNAAGELVALQLIVHAEGEGPDDD
jgi:hypothetical protein